MSPNVGNFVHDLVEMAKAMETLPQVQAQLDDINRQNGVLNNQIEVLKADLEQSRNYAASLEQKVRNTEAERDDAELRFLELDEKAHKVLAHVASIQAAALVVQESLTPPKPQPEPEPVKQEESQLQGQSEAPPIQSAPSQEAQSVGGANNGTMENASHETPQPPASQGQGEVNPPSATSPVDHVSGTGEQPVNAGENAITSPEPKPSGPYTNKYYSDHPVYVSPHDWLAGGGSEDKYFPKAVSDEYKY